MPKVTAPTAMSVSADQFTPPAVEVGQLVLWSHGQGDKPAPAIVLQVGMAAITVAVHINGVKDHVLKNGARHVDDPFVRTHPQHDQGVWDLTPRDKRIDALLENYGGSVLGEE